MKRARDFRAIARSALAGHWGLAVGITLVATLLGGLGSGGGGSSGGNSYHEGTNIQYSSEIYAFFELMMPFIITIVTFALMIGIALFIIGGAVELGLNHFNISLILGQPVRFSMLFSRFSIFGKALGLRMFRVLFIFLWSLLLIIPGIIAALSYSMAGYIMAERPEVGIREAVDISKGMMLGNKGRLFCLFFSFIGWIILGIFTFGIGYLWLMPYIQASIAAFYIDVSRNSDRNQLRPEMI